MNVENEIKQLKHQVQLLYSNTPVDRLFFEFDITTEQWHLLDDLMKEYSRLIHFEQRVSQSDFKEKIMKIVSHLNEDDLFYELLEELSYESKYYVSVFEHFHR
ncbi:hypothetical protein LZ578_08260 [Jeotgalibaca sp. MA1X17-3]|uniref:hypothetical protein n=1 Tax=Jeotgalibaca sp. MA1X17-3 TaxID=2908211 RepID=UPI001F1EA87D|nr:hypothetical protein [Jeotgalibaca sp. MA1X17-3]UJF14999.1 hypothetical protein LZ578_08260 [Jeotgalibaca sp. MA1X17-3]